MLTGLEIMIGGFLLSVLGLFISDSLMIIVGIEVLVGALVFLYNYKGA